MAYMRVSCKKYWQMVKDALLLLVATTFEMRMLPSTLNDTQIVLTPKVANLEYVEQFRIRSLCYVMCKHI